MKFLLVVISFFAASFYLQAQDFAKLKFTSPLDTPLIVTGTFGEIRENHLHSGIDLSTNEEEGVPVKCIGDGYISRIKIAPDGYGKALYITHPNGYVSVYGHLKTFTDPVNEYVKKLQYERKVFELDIKLKEKEFRVKQREVIAFSGSTGGADAPHLHFEIREELTEEPMNPLLFGLPVTDNIPPVLKYVRIIPQRENGIVNKTDSGVTYTVQQSEGKNMLGSLEYPLVFGNISFALCATDYQGDSASVLGIYSGEFYVDGVFAYSWKFDRFNFNETRDVNAHVDYLSLMRDRLNMERCGKLAGNRLKLYVDSLQSRSLFLGEDLSHDIRMVVSDFSGNKSELIFQVITYSSLSENQYQPKSPEPILVSVEKGVAFHKSKLDVMIPEGAAYDEFLYDDEVIKSVNYMSDIYRIGDPYEPLRASISIGIKPDVIVADSLKPKMLIVRINDDRTLKPCGGAWNGKFENATTSTFGKYAVAIDTVPPVAELTYKPGDMNSMLGGTLQVKIMDDLSGIKSYSGKIDDKWHLFEYDRKKDLLSADVNGMGENKEHRVEITLTDERGNSRVWATTFYF